MSAAERLRLQKEQFVRENTPSGGWERGVHHPLAKWLNYGDKTAIAASLKMTRQSVDNVLHGRISWTPSDGVRGDGKRRILWKTYEFVWAMIVVGAKPPSIPPKRGSQSQYKTGVDF